MKYTSNITDDNWTLSDNSTHLFSRGYTGHEHLDKFGLINMNGRRYDSKLARFLSPDPVLQDPSNTQNFNRYSYCLNNPFAYTDPSGYVYGGANSNYVAGGTMPYYNNPGLSNFNTGSFHSTYDNDWGNYSANADGYFGSNGPAGVFGSANSSIILGQFQDCITDIQNGYNIAYREGSGGYYLWFGGGRDNTISGEHIDQVLLNYSQVSLVSQMVEAYGESRSERNREQSSEGNIKSGYSASIYLVETVNTLYEKNLMKGYKYALNRASAYKKITNTIPKSLRNSLNYGKTMTSLTRAAGRGLFLVGTTMTVIDMASNPTKENLVLGSADLIMGGVSLFFPVAGVIYFSGRMVYDMVKD